MLVWFAQIIRSFFFAIDYNLFSFIETLYNLLIQISRTTILTQGDIKEFADRVQMLLGVFMLFKVSFSLITFVINPDEMTDKSKGFAKLGQNVIISLVLLIVTPYIFGMAYDLQIMVLEDNTIANLIFGTDDGDSFLNTGGQKLSFSVMLPFFRPNTGLTSLYDCNNLYSPGDSSQFNSACENALYKIVKDQHNDELDKRVLGNYITGVTHKSFGLTFRQEAVTFLDNDKNFVFDYKILLSSAAAIVVILILLIYAMEVALRSVKLAFLQLISPIPIISYIDPKQGKDGMFKKWYTMCFSTYISLFIRLLALYFGLYLIDIVINKGFTDVLTAESVTGFWLTLFMIIGILMFIKQLPKILEGFGFKLDGGGKFTLNPLKKFENDAFGGKQILGAAGGLTSGVADRGARIATARNGRELAAALAGSLIGIPGSTIRGFRDGKGFGSGMKAQNAVNRRLREGRMKGLTARNSYLDYVGSWFGLDDATLEREGRILHQNSINLQEAELQAAEGARQHNVAAANLEHSNATRKDTLSALDNAKSKGESLQKYVETYLGKKANFGVDTSEQTLYSHLESMVGTGAVTSRDITLGDGTFIATGSDIDEKMLLQVRRSANREMLTQNVNEDKHNIQLMEKMKPGDDLKADIMIGNRLFSKGEVISGAMLESARQAAYDYEKSVTEHLHNMFESNIVSGTDDSAQRDFNNLRNEFTRAVSDANNDIRTYNSEYGTSVGNINRSISYSDLDSTIKSFSNSSDFSDMRTESARINASITDHKREAERIKYETEATYIDENNVERRLRIDDFKSVYEPRKKRFDVQQSQHKESRTFMSNVNNK